MSWWFEYSPDCEKASHDWLITSSATASCGELTELSRLRHTAGPMKPIDCMSLRVNVTLVPLPMSCVSAK